MAYFGDFFNSIVFRYFIIQRFSSSTHEFRVHNNIFCFNAIFENTMRMKLINVINYFLVVLIAVDFIFSTFFLLSITPKFKYAALLLCYCLLLFLIFREKNRNSAGLLCFSVKYLLIIWAQMYGAQVLTQSITPLLKSVSAIIMFMFIFKMRIGK